MTPQHHIIKETSDSISRLLQDEFKRSGYKRVHMIDEAPRPDAVEGKLPAVSVYLYQISLDPDGTDFTPHSEIVEVAQPDGTFREFKRQRRLWIRLDYLLSAWAQTPEDEQLLLGLLLRTCFENPSVPRDRLRGQAFESDFKLVLQLSARLDEGTLARFWGSLDQPVRPAVQAWTLIPIIPERLEEFTRVETRSLEYRSITDPRVSEQGPSPNPFARRLDLGGGKR
jgi:Pvc16 N-terminal domain